MLTTVLVIVILAVLAIVAYAATKPSAFRIERSITIDAPPQAVFDIVQDFGRTREWLPWDALDPAMKRTISTPASGVGASYEWEGNKKVGAGRQEIIATEPPRLIRVMIDFFRPMKARNTVEYTFAPQGGGTRVNWAMFGDFPLMSRIFDIFMNIDTMVGKDFEKGLASLKALAETKQIGGH
jgi:uncharacterized protein YndB with AHSA1/START domain